MGYAQDQEEWQHDAQRMIHTVHQKDGYREAGQRNDAAGQMDGRAQRHDEFAVWRETPFSQRTAH